MWGKDWVNKNIRGFLMTNDKEESLKRKYEEEALDRKAKAGIQADISTAPLKMVKHYVRKKPLINQVVCVKCGKIFKTNRKTKLCFSCERKKK